MTALALTIGLTLTVCAGESSPPAIEIRSDRTSVTMGREVVVEASVRDGDGQPIAGCLLLPYVNGRRWGSHEYADAAGHAQFVVPLPNPGTATLEAVCLPEFCGAAGANPPSVPWPGPAPMDVLLAGRPKPESAVTSNAIEVEVSRRAMPDRRSKSGFIGVQWEPWFTPLNAYWQTAQAVPVLGFYDSYDPDVRRQHVLWCIELGIDFIMPDWSNHIWGKQHWSERGEGANQIIQATTMMFDTLAEMRGEGLPVPKMVLMPGLSNGEPTTMGAINEMLDWCRIEYLEKERYKGLSLEYDGKPLIVILDTWARASQEPVPVDETHFTVRWMSTQLQRTRHHELGYWTWMDGVLEPVVTYRDGKAEAITVTPAYFGDGGWTYPQARGRRGGTTYIESFKAAIAHRPLFVQLHQWNEYAGQPIGQGYGEKRDVFVDSYSVELSDDLEPVSLTAPGYRGDNGGWGFYYFNLTRALLDKYRGDAPGDTILCVGNPVRGAQVVGETLLVDWAYVGPAPASFRLWIDGAVVADNVRTTSHEIDITGLEPGAHRLILEADGATSRYALAHDRMDDVLTEPAALRVEVPFLR